MAPVSQCDKPGGGKADIAISERRRIGAMRRGTRTPCFAGRKTRRILCEPGIKSGAASSPGPMKVPDDQLRKTLGIANVTFK
jgi:hypothetical protein